MSKKNTKIMLDQMKDLEHWDKIGLFFVIHNNITKRDTQNPYTNRAESAKSGMKLFIYEIQPCPQSQIFANKNLVSYTQMNRRVSGRMP